MKYSRSECTVLASRVNVSVSFVVVVVVAAAATTIDTAIVAVGS